VLQRQDISVKLRVRGDTLRLRLTRGETEAIGRGEPVAETTRFPDGTSLRYELVPAATRAARQVAGVNGTRICIEIPRGDAAAWADSNEVGLTGDGPFRVGPLSVLVEKDFACLAPRAGEQELDTFPNPNAQPD